MNDTSKALLENFEQLQVHAPDFHHEDHVRVAFAMLKKYEFVDACTRYASTIRQMATSVGVPEKYNATITIAFMSLVAERMTERNQDDVELFLAENQERLGRSALANRYSDSRINSDAARSQFLLPDKALN